MSNSSDEIVVGANGTVWVADTSETAPTDVGTAMGVTTPGTQEVQVVVLTGFGGTDDFHLTYGGQESADIIRGTNYTAAGIEAAYAGISGVTDTITVTDVTDAGFLVTFDEVGSKSALSVTNPTGCTGAVTTLHDGTAASGSSNWLELGFIDENGVTWTDGKTVTPIPVWQSFYAARRIVEARENMVAFALRQWDAVTVPFAFGGGEVTANGGEWMYTPPSPEELDERSMVVEWQDGDKNYRLYFPRGMVTDNVETKLVRSAAADLPIVFSALSDGSEDIYTFFTDDPAFAV